MNTLLETFEKKIPEIVYEWQDTETEARGWLVINSLRNGAAAGGTRMSPGLDKNEVISLAKTMEVKFTVSGPPIGGAKSGINFDPQDPRKQEVLTRWFKAVSPILKSFYGTGGDMNVDVLMDVVPLTEQQGIWHPMEGVINGHFNQGESNKVRQISQLRAGVSKVIEDPEYLPEGGKTYRVADLITGYGVAESVLAFYRFHNKALEDKRVVVQGWGNVAAAAALYLAKEGARVVGIIDRQSGLIDPDGLGTDQVKSLFFNRDGNALNTPNMLGFDEINKQIWQLEAEVFLPCAGSRLVTQDNIQAMTENGLQVIACGANVPFADTEAFYGPISEYADTRVAVIPDFIANNGMARVFAHMMQIDATLTDRAIFADVSEVIEQAVIQLCKQCPESTGLMAAALEQSISTLV